MANPTNCFICKNTWLGKGPLCTKCSAQLAGAAPPPPICQICNGPHTAWQCPTVKLAGMATTTARIRYRYTNSAASRLKTCPTCKGNYIIESKAGSVCSNCKTVVHNPCRNCNSPNTRGLSAPDPDLVPGLGNIQFIECQDCLFIE